MSDTNGAGHVNDVLRDVLSRANADDGTLLRDIRESQPMVRLFLLGGPRNNAAWPSGELRIVRAGRSICVTLAVRQLEIEAKYYDERAESCLERIENDIALDTVPWEPDYKGRQRLERKLLS